MKSIQELAENYLSMFELKTRKNGDKYYCVKDDCKNDELTDVIRTAHGDMMPDDYKYQFIHDALELISESNDLDDINIESDCYTSDLLKWVSSNLNRINYFDKAMTEYECICFVDILSTAQKIERDEVLQSVIQSLEKILGE